MRCKLGPPEMGSSNTQSAATATVAPYRPNTYTRARTRIHNVEMQMDCRFGVMVSTEMRRQRMSCVRVTISIWINE